MTRHFSSILVTGGAGFIGSAFIRHLLSLADFNGKIINFDALSYAGNLENLSSVEHDPRYLFEKGNICDKPHLLRLCHEHQVDLIVHFAAESHVDRSILSPMDFAHTNVLGTLTLLEVVREIPSIHFHHVSTDEVYGSLGEDGIFTEDSPYSPNSPYSASKASSDHFVKAYTKTYKLNTTISNCSNNYGPYQFPEKLIPLVIMRCHEEETIPVYGKGENVRDWLYVDDHVEAIWLISQKAKSGSYYNIGGNCEVKNIDIVRSIIDCYSNLTSKSADKLRSLITYVTDRPGHDFRYAIDCSNIKNDLGWEPKYSFKNGLNETVKWYLDNMSWVDHIKSGEYQKWIEANYAAR
ncbi:MAG: dTDP-glucose 4,6-dehydratase [Chlamydiales bacterium]|nr:dTDP-glucose 4,6-dehydratase [Chlamydiales bacterium]